MGAMKRQSRWHMLLGSATNTERLGSLEVLSSTVPVTTVLLEMAVIV